MIAEAGLSFLGLGDPGIISWGKILVAAQENAFTSDLWAWVIAPGGAIFITVFGFMQIGSALEDILNPKLKRAKPETPEAIDAVFASISDISEEKALTLKGRYHECVGDSKFKDPLSV